MKTGKSLWRFTKDHPIPAVLLAHQLMANKQCVERGKKGIPEAVKGLDLAIDALFRHTDFYKVSHKLYLRRLEGTIHTKQDEKLPELSVKTGSRSPGRKARDLMGLC